MSRNETRPRFHITRTRIKSWLIVLWISAHLALNFAAGQEVEVEVVEEADDVLVAAQPVWSDENLDQWVFQNHSNSIKARQHLQSQLLLQTQDVERVCTLTPAQKLKLQLAGRGDIKRFFDHYARIKRRFQLIKHDQQKFNEIWQDITPLQTSLQAGLFHSDSFLYKSLRNTLNEAQYAAYLRIVRERREFQHQAKIELAVAVLEQGVPLNEEQRQRLIALLAKETDPPPKSGPYHYYVIMYQAARLPEEKLTVLLDETQWKVFRQQLNQVRGMEQWLKQSGVLPEDDEAP